MLTLDERGKYSRFLLGYKVGNRYLQNTADYFVIMGIEQKDPRWTQAQRENNGVNVPSLTYVETITQPTAAPKPIEQPLITSNMITPLFTTQPTTLTPQRGELIPTNDTTTVGLPPGTTTTATNESFISKYKMPLIIGAIAVGYMLFKKK